MTGLKTLLSLQNEYTKRIQLLQISATVKHHDGTSAYRPKASAGGTVLHELLQNADDAGATAVVCYLWICF